MSDKRFGSMFDDDEDMNPVVPTSTAGVNAEPKAPAPVLLNTEARALLERKARIAGRHAKGAAQKSVDAVVWATSMVRHNALRLGASVDHAGSRLPWRRIAAGILVVSVVGGATAWLVLSKDPDNVEPSPMVVPIVPPPSAVPIAAVAEEAQESGAVIDQVSELPPVETLTEELMVTGVPSASGRYVPSQVEPDGVMGLEPTSEVPQELSALERADLHVNRTADAVENAEPRPRVPSVVKPERQRVAAPTPSKPAQAPAPVGQREQQQIEQIKALFGEER